MLLLSYSRVLFSDAGNTAAPLRVNVDGSLPSMSGKYVTSGASVTLPPLSQSFFVLLDAGATQCM